MTANQGRVSDFTSKYLRRPLRFPNQPAGAEQRVATDEPETAEDTEHAQKDKRSPGEDTVLQGHPADYPAED